MLFGVTKNISDLYYLKYLYYINITNVIELDSSLKIIVARDIV